MKMYVRGYRGKPEEELEKLKPWEKHENTEIYFEENPTWIMQTVWEAESECGILHKMRTHVGEHYCTFSVEEQPKGGFAVICNMHPEPPDYFHSARVMEGS